MPSSTSVSASGLKLPILTSLAMCSRHSRAVKSSGTSSPRLEYCKNTLPTSLVGSSERNTSPHATWTNPGNTPSSLPCVPLPLPGAPNSNTALIRFAMSVQKLIPIVAPMRLVAQLPNESLHRRFVDVEGRAGRRHDIFLHHHAAEIIRAELQRHLPDLRALRDPT